MVRGEGNTKQALSLHPLTPPGDLTGVLLLCPCHRCKDWAWESHSF